MAARSKKTTYKNKGKKKQSKQNPLAKDILLLGIVVFGILCLLSVFHACGILGEYLSALLFGLFGALAYIFPVYMVVACGLYIANPKNQMLRRKIWLSLGFYWSLCGAFQWVVNYDVSEVWDIYSVCAATQGGGGFMGGLLSFELAKGIGRAGSAIIILAALLLFTMLISGKQILSALGSLYTEQKTHKKREKFYEYEPEPPVRNHAQTMNTYKFEKEDTTSQEGTSSPAKKRRTKKNAKVAEVLPDTEPFPEKQPAAEEKKTDPVQDIHIIRGNETAESSQPIYEKELDDKFGSEKPKPAKKASKKETSPTVEPKQEKKEEKAIHKQLDKAALSEVPYRFPPLSLLNRPAHTGKGIGNQVLKETALKLQSTLQSFGVGVQLGDISLGPSVTRYELIPDQGVKVSKITSLADDIKLSLAASDIRIEAPIPGKSAVGIEVPNPQRTMITLRELLESDEFIKAKSKVTFAVGKDISGKTIVTDIAKMPHLLIAGATGSGKSVLINTLIMSIIYKADPNEVKMIMVDPKMVELTAYEDIPHLMIPVVKDPKKASAALGWAVAEMTGRYQKFAETGVRDIFSYNARIEKAGKTDDPAFQKMPQIIIIVDEFADLMMVAPGEVEDAVCRLAQLARAAGIHLVLATQRPSVNVITGLIKANIPSRIALSVSSGVDSRTIIDSVGAEKLLGNGDMLFAPQNLPNPIRVQGAFVSDEERDGVVSFLKKNSDGPSYNSEVTAHIESAPAPGTAGGNTPGDGQPDRDELFVEAGMFIIEKDKASIGLLQRMFRIGFNRAARIMDQLADAGVVSGDEGTKARTILMSKEQFENYLEENG